MFHKALWMRNYKQGKIAITLLWATSFFSLPLSYLFRANDIARNFAEWPDWEYSYYFSYSIPFLSLGALLILLGCLLINGNRTNQGMDTIFAMPFKRRNIFLSKWLIGAVNILAITLVNMLLMYIVQQTTIHKEFHTIAPFFSFFLFMFIVLLTIYSLTLFIGTLAGNFSSQAMLSAIICILPIGLHTLINSFIGWHSRWIYGHGHHYYAPIYRQTVEAFFNDISIIPGMEYYFSFQGDARETIIFLQNAPSTTTYIALFMYLVSSFLLGLFLYQQTPNEHTGNIILYKQLEPLFIWGTVSCFALLGGEIVASGFSNGGWSFRLINYYIGLIIFGLTSYFILAKLLKKPFKIKKIKL